MNIHELIQLQALKQKATHSNQLFVDLAVEREEIETRQMCAKVPPVLIERLDQVCGYLDISKRRFIEAAVATAIDEAERSILNIESQGVIGGEEG